MSDTTALFPSKHYRDAFYAQLKLLPIKFIHIGFQGGGDSGEIYSIEAIPKDEGNVVHLSEIELLWPKVNYASDPVEEVLTSLDKIVEDIGYRALDMSDLDWYNNEGGQGYVDIILDDGEPHINMHMEINYTKTDDYEFDSRDGNLKEVAEDENED